MRVALYARERPTDQDGQERVDVQLRFLRKWCQKQGYEIAGEYSDTARVMECVADIPNWPTG